MKANLGIGALLLSLLLLTTRRTKASNTSENNSILNNNLPTLTDADIKAGIQSIKQKYGLEVAKAVEQMYRLETSHFKSLGFKNTYGAGALAFSGQNMGWGTVNLQKYGVQPKTWDYIVNGKTYHYLVFNSFPNALNFLADYLIRNSSKGDINAAIQKWGSSLGYLNKVRSITAKYI